MSNHETATDLLTALEVLVATFRVRLPRPAAEPSADAKCPTCRCMIAPGSTCACCASTSGDDPPLPDLDRDDAEPSASGDDVRPEYSASTPKRIVMAGYPAPSASGDGIARADRLRVYVGDHYFVETDELAAKRTARIINAAHEHATRALREQLEHAGRSWMHWQERAEKAERERIESSGAYSAAHERIKSERDAAIARAEAAERVVKAVRAIAAPGMTQLRIILADYDAARKDGGK